MSTSECVRKVSTGTHTIIVIITAVADAAAYKMVSSSVGADAGAAAPAAGIKAVLLDIEGTTTSISFVKVSGQPPGHRRTSLGPGARSEFVM